MRNKPSRFLFLLIPVIILLVALFNPLRSALSFRQINDFPLYSMHLYGDYGFEEYLQSMEEQAHAASSAPAAPQWACSVFTALNPTGEALLARNFDWYHHSTLVLFTHPKDGYDSVSTVDIAYFGFEDRPPSFFERFQLADLAYMPFDGMNEAGLAVGMMAINHAEARLNPENPTIDSISAIRLLLDRAATVDEAITLLQGYNIDFEGGPPIHYLVADASGRSVVIEYINNEMRIIDPLEPHWQVSTNFLLSEHAPKHWPEICARYQKASQQLSTADGRLTPDQAMQLLQQVSQKDTQWSVVYDLQNGDIQLTVGHEYDDVINYSLPIRESNR